MFSLRYLFFSLQMVEDRVRYFLCNFVRLFNPRFHIRIIQSTRCLCLCFSCKISQFMVVFQPLAVVDIVISNTRVVLSAFRFLG